MVYAIEDDMLVLATEDKYEYIQHDLVYLLKKYIIIMKMIWR